VSGERGGTLSWTACLCPTLATLHAVADEAGHTEADQQQDIGTGLWDADGIVLLLVLFVMSLFVMVRAWLCCVTHDRREHDQSRREYASSDRPQYREGFSLHDFPLPFPKVHCFLTRLLTGRRSLLSSPRLKKGRQLG